MPPLVRKASAFAFAGLSAIRRRTCRASGLSRSGGVRAPALPDATA